MALGRAPIDLASTMLGKREVPNRAEIQDYLTTGGANLDPVTTAWCAAFVNSTLAQSGLPTTGSNLARSFLKYGTPVDTPQRGDIAVFTRGDPNGPFGHVGFVDSLAGNNVRLLSGNSSNAVTLQNYPLAQLLGYRRPPQMAQAAAPAPAAAPVPAPSPAPAAMPANPAPQSPNAPAWPSPQAPGPSQPQRLGDFLAQQSAPTDLATIAASFLQQGQQRAQQERAVNDQEEAVERQRKLALFGGGGGLAGLYARG